MAFHLNRGRAAFEVLRNSARIIRRRIQRVCKGALLACILIRSLVGATVTLSWTDNSNNEEGFVVQRRIVAGAYSDLATVRDDRVQFVDSSLQPGITYLYRIAAFNSFGRSHFSPAVSVVVPAESSQTGQPFLQALSNRTAAVGQDLGVVSLGLSHSSGDTSDLRVIATSSNPALIPNETLVVEGAGAARTLALVPTPNQTGVAVVTVVVSDKRESTSRSFVVTVGSGEVTELSLPQQMYFGSIGSGATRGWFGFLAQSDRTAWFVGDGPEFPFGCVNVPVALGPGGEFSFELIGLGNVRGVVSRSTLAGVVGPSATPMIGLLENPTGSWATSQGIYRGAVAGTLNDQAVAWVGSSGRAIVAVTHRGYLRSFEVNLDAQEYQRMGGPDDLQVSFRARPAQGLIEGTLFSSQGLKTWAARLEARAAVERIINVSVRAVLEASSDVLVVGFTVGGIGMKPVVMRAVGPTLGRFGVPDVLPDPRLEVFRQGTGETPFAFNDSWNEQLLPPASSYGGFSLQSGSADAAIAATLASGSYTARVGTATGDKGQVLLELYDGDMARAFSGARLSNISVLTRVKDNNARVIGGFSVDGEIPRRLLVRAVGPELSAFGVTGTLKDPVLELYSADGRLQAEVDDSPSPSGLFSELVSRTGAFALEAVTKSSAHLVWLSPGVYTAHVKSGDGSPGTVLLEIYEVP